ncbi:MarR family winged helix-turn-helix transcriptional regulator [Thermomonospora echinospora]|uniref:MarR family winged helix-turn-helix transcriptional regulator n=1 Tax=Thermomonospora echinospora TaxID=1992 RepID=UPI0011AFF3A3|nr:MarR family winged helix-turn-helix transcriptional regulator [Thermomonospora echinospora]
MHDRCGAGPVAPDPVLLLPTHLMAELLKLARRTSAELFPTGGLRPPHVVALAWLDGHGPMSQRQVSERMRVNPADMVGVVDELERLGHVERRRDPRDRRRYALHLTDSGRRALHDWRARGERLNDTVFAPLAPHERDTLQELLLKVLVHHDPRFAPAVRHQEPDRVSRST